MFAANERLSRNSFVCASAACALWVFLFVVARFDDPAVLSDFGSSVEPLFMASPLILATLASTGLALARAAAQHGESRGAVLAGMAASAFMLVMALGLGLSFFLVGGAI